MKFGLRVPPCASPRQVSATIVRAEVEGFDHAWVPDAQLLWRDVWVTLGTDVLRSFGIPAATVSEVSGIYPDLAHAEDWDRAVELTDCVPPEVLEAFCEKFCLMGTADDVAAKVKRLAGYGVRNLYIRGFYSYAMPTAVAEASARTVMPRLR